jgi:hypothetical protein
VITALIVIGALAIGMAGTVAARGLTMTPKGHRNLPRHVIPDGQSMVAARDVPDEGMTSQFEVIAARKVLPVTPPESAPAVIDVEPRISGGREAPDA